MARNIDEFTDRIFLLSEYKYYMPSLNEAGEEDEESEDAGEEFEDGDDIEDADLGGEEEAEGGEGEEDLEGGEFGEDDIAGAFDEEGGEDEFGGEEMGEEEVEIDVSSIVSNVEDNGQAIGDLTQKLDGVTSQFNQYIDKVIKASQSVASRIDQMEKNMNKEFVKRNPTPHESLRNIAMSSYPYNQPLDAYWKPAKGGEYDYTLSNPNTSPNDNDLGGDEFQIKKGSEEDQQPKEYILTDKDVDDDYLDTDIRQTF